jgi:hypothetical protein
MGRVGKGKTLINVSVPNAWRDEIDRRAEGLHLTRATFTMLILAKWWQDGRAPVSEPDKLMQIAAKTVAQKSQRRVS